MPDISYRTDGLFIRFYADTDAGQVAWSTLAAYSDNSGAFLAVEGQAIIRRLRAAGYSVAKARKVTISDDELLEALA